MNQLKKSNYILITRESKLALWQANYIQSAIADLPNAPKITILSTTSEGDINLADSLAKIGGKGLFIKNLEVAIKNHTADFAVHSMKDVPMKLEENFIISAIPKRSLTSDALVSNNYTSLDDLPKNAVVGTSSLRRMSQILAYRSDLQVKPLRGNLDTRLGKLDAGGYDAIILAEVGLIRLGYADRIAQVLPQDICLPAVGQGALAIESLQDNDINSTLLKLQDENTAWCLSAERAFANALEASCSAPVAAIATLDGQEMKFIARVIAHDGTKTLEDKTKTQVKNIEDAIKIGQNAAKKMLSMGAIEILKSSQAYIDAL